MFNANIVQGLWMAATKWVMKCHVIKKGRVNVGERMWKKPSLVLVWDGMWFSVSIAWQSDTLKDHWLQQPSHLHFLTGCIKGTLLPVLAGNISISHKSCAAEPKFLSSKWKMYFCVFHRITFYLFEVWAVIRAELDRYWMVVVLVVLNTDSVTHAATCIDNAFIIFED